MTTWTCPKCGHEEQQPDHVQVMAHYCSVKAIKRTVMVKQYEQDLARAGR